MQRFHFTPPSILKLCGQTSYAKGERLLRSRKVEITRLDQSAGTCEAAVKGINDRYMVKVSVSARGDIDTSCTCPQLGSYRQKCQHIAAVLLYLQKAELGQAGTDERRTGSDGDSGSVHAPAGEEQRELADSILALFDGQPARPSRHRLLLEKRTSLRAAFTLYPVPYGNRKALFGLEMRAGPGKTYVVPRIRDLLDKIDQGAACAFSRYCEYEPSRHSFSAEDDAVLRLLIRIRGQEKLYRESSAQLLPYGRGPVTDDRTLLIPPVFWPALLPLLGAAQMVRLEVGDRVYEEIRLSDDKLPLVFELDRAVPGSADYRLTVQGLADVTIMEDYGIAIHDGGLLKLPEDAGRQLAGLRQMLASAGMTDDSRSTPAIRIPLHQMEDYMQKVMPGLAKLGRVKIDPQVAGQLTQVPLKARLYLDRVKDRLLAGLEFHYGELALNPLEPDGRSRVGGRILVRDAEKEQRILALLEESAFTRSESGYFMTDEEGEFEFLHEIVPRMEPLADIYATSAVKARLFKGHVPPKIYVDADEKNDWLSCRFELDGFPPDEIRDLINAVSDKRKYYKLRRGALMPLDGAEFREMIRFLNEVGMRSLEVTGAEIRVPLLRGLYLIDPGQRSGSIKLGPAFRKLLDDLAHPDNLVFPIPDGLQAVLRDYQTIGYQWMRTLAHFRFGGILADDMGLGKTLQSIAFLLSMLPEIRSERLPALIVCPASLLYNWLAELGRFAPEMQAVVADGSKSERRAIANDWAGADVVITSYPLLLRDHAWYAGQERKFHTLILDEAQYFKNDYTQTAKVVKAVQAKHRFALTGTPVENRLNDLWNICDTVFPGLFPDKASFGELPQETVARRIRPFLLRRLKRDVLTELPEKIDTVHTSELLPEQKKLYIAHLAKLQKESLKFLTKQGVREEKQRIQILAGLTRLRQLCCHPALFVEDYGGRSAKFEQLLEVVEEGRGAGRRMLVFSQFTSMLDMIGRELGERDVPFFYLDGATPSAERVELCQRFNDGERDVFLISLRAGGTGLNLTGADTVILYDMWWNPAVEEQAADRAHRFGQKQVVQVIRLVARDTVEEKMYALQQRKRHLIEEVIQPGHESLSSLSEEDLREILMLE